MRKEIKILKKIKELKAKLDEPSNGLNDLQKLNTQIETLLWVADIDVGQEKV